MSTNNTNTNNPTINHKKGHHREKGRKKSLIKPIILPPIFETNYQSSESVARTLVDKILSLTASRAFSEKINK